ncbi:hypothetical protein HY214_04575 [Candidatus Roizmanbacteria bacterium]|nr:hypothetical protein [Candidatus Roizmanbacteria bacterium]
MKTLVIATKNSAKFTEISRAINRLERDKVRLLSLNDFPRVEEPVETGKTFKDNAFLKAKHYAELTGAPCLSDDAGLSIDILNGEPGVRSRRWPGHEASDQELIDFTLQKLKGVPRKKRSAKLQLCLCFYDPQTKIALFEEAATGGYIAEKPLSNFTPGYPFRAVFIVDRFHKYYQRLTPEEHELVNHRFLAATKLAKKIIPLLLE